MGDLGNLGNLDDSCGICGEKYNKKTRKTVNCLYCNYSACSPCVKHYLLDSITSKCLSCPAVWNRENIYNTLPKTFLTTDYKLHMENILFDEEKSYFAETMPYIEAINDPKSTNKKYEDEIWQLNRPHELRKIQYNYLWHLREKELNENDEYVQAIRRNLYPDKIINEHPASAEIAMLKRQIDNFDNTEEYRIIENLQTRNEQVYTAKRCIERGDKNFNLNFMNTADKEKTVKFHQPCSVPECKGMLSHAWKCAICSTYTCLQCHKPKLGGKYDENHVCDQNDLDSVKLIKDETKECPKCYSAIYRTFGCDQMWCTVCNVAFSWRTGKIDRGVVHNPHYFEWRQQNNVVNNNPCGLIDRDELLRNVDENETNVFVNIHAFVLDFMNILERNRPNPNYKTPDLNRNLRVLYLMGKMSEEDFKTQIQRINKSIEKTIAINQVIEMFINVMCDILRRVTMANNCLDEIHKIREYYNEHVKKTADVYGSKSFVQIDPTFTHN